MSYEHRPFSPGGFLRGSVINEDLPGTANEIQRNSTVFLAAVIDRAALPDGRIFDGVDQLAFTG